MTSRESGAPSSNTGEATSGRRVLEIIPIGSPDLPTDMLERLGADLERHLPVRATVLPAIDLLGDWYDEQREQYASGHIVDALIDRSEAAEPPDSIDAPDAPWTLAITDVDLFAPGRDFVFGEATLGGRWALVSTARLQPDERLGTGLLYRRLLKEAVHELGHLPGLEHCDNRRCVMNPSHDARDVDSKPPEFCPSCSQTLVQHATDH